MSTKGSRIFIVDDDAATGKSFARLLKSVGYEVETFLSADDFLRRDVYTGASCLLVDVRMPGMTGFDLQRALAKRAIAIPIVFLTALVDESARLQAMKNGAVDFLLKPVDVEKLTDAVERAFKRRQGN